jgi:O-methyltransferase
MFFPLNMKKIKRLIKKCLQLFNVEIKHIRHSSSKQIPFYNDLDEDLAYEYNAEALEAIKIVRKQTMSPYINLETLYEQVVYIEKNHIEGNYIECGVWKGGAVGLMALANLKYGSYRRDLCLFDIFDDICEPDPANDGAQAVKEFNQLTGKKQQFSGKLSSVKGVYKSLGGAGSLIENKKLLEEIIHYPRVNIHYYQGWFQDTVLNAGRKIEKIAILRLDGDLYASIKVCINGLYDKLVKGGIIIIDDYGSYDGCRKAIDEFRNENNITTFMNYSNAFCRYWFKE